ncbi:MAG: hypothetical protein WDZ76_00930 [Pseudohongiellaceae bacterium]
MKSGLIRNFMAIVAISAFSQFALAADEDAAEAIAGILVDLNHFPSDAEKQTLMGISNDSSNSEAMQTIAMAIHDMQHQVSGPNADALNQIVTNDSASEEARKLAEIVLGITHMPSADAKAELQAMI